MNAHWLAGMNNHLQNHTQDLRRNGNNKLIYLITGKQIHIERIQEKSELFVNEVKV